MDKARATEILSRQIEAGSRLRYGNDAAFAKWTRDAVAALERIFGADSRQVDGFRGMHYHPSIVFSGSGDGPYVSAFETGMETALAALASARDEVEQYWDDDNKELAPAPLLRIERICQRFHRVARQLRARHGGRTTLDVGDEYDVQDLLHALLVVDFDDVRPEEWCPSYAGASSRMDFLLKKEQLVVEVKKTRKGLGAREIGEQLIIDSGRYQSHPDCKMLVCFVYDPEGLVANPRGVENDLNDPSGTPDVRVYIEPRN